MLKVKKITIENFRGIKPALEIDFFKGGNSNSVLIYGRNGTGKSSVVDAWEWLNTFGILNLNKEGISAKDFPHKSSGGNGSYISVDFQHASINSTKATFNPAKITAPTTAGEYSQFKEHSKYPNYLRYSDLQDFVYKSKTKKYEYIAKFFGLESYTKNQTDLQSYINKLAVKLTEHQNNFNNSSSKVKELTGNDTVDEQTVVAFINAICTRHKLGTINHFKEVKKVKQELQKLVENNPKTKELIEWKAFQTKLNQFYPVDETKTELENLETIFSDIQKDAKNITNLILAGLYQTSIDVIPKLEDQTKCPVCDTVFDGDLLEHIKEKHKTLDALNQKKLSYDSKRTALEKIFTSLITKIAAIQSETGTIVLSTFKNFFDDLKVINNAIPTAISKLKKQVTELDSVNISSEEFIGKSDSISENEKINKETVIAKIKALEEDEARKSLAQDYENIINIINNYYNCLVYSKKTTYLNTLKSNLDKLFGELTTFIQNKIQNTFTNISADVIDCFNTLENNHPFLKNPEIKLLTGKDKAIELEIEFVTEKITPAFKFLSESQVNSFGLAIFLAAVKHFNSQFKFIILDDVVNSFDSFKRPRVSQLLATKYSDFQILVLTHDQIFFDTMQRAFPNWSRYKFLSWDYITGPRFRIAKNYVEEIQELLDEDRPILAGQSLGRYLEWTFGELNQNLKTAIPYKIENVYTLAEFFDPLKARFNKLLKQPNKQHKLLLLFDQLETGTIFRNYCAHWKNEASQFTKEEIEAVFKKWIEIETLIYCSSCKSFVKHEKINTVEYVRCNCTTINLQDDSSYEMINAQQLN